MTIHVMTDSGSDIDPAWYENLSVIPLVVTFGTQEYLDGVDLSAAEFYERLKHCDKLPSTSQISPYTFSEALRPHVYAGEEVLLITMSSKLSGTYESAVAAAADFDGHVVVVDSLNVTVGERILVDRAVALAAQGVGIHEIAAELESLRSRVRLVALLDTLEYLKKGGRIPAAAATAGALLKVKPVIAIEDGVVKLLGGARGSRKGNNYLMEQVKVHGDIDFCLPFFLGYTGADDALLQRYIQDSAALWEGKADELPVMTVGSIIGTHVGPGAVAVAFVSRD